MRRQGPAPAASARCLPMRRSFFACRQDVFAHSFSSPAAREGKLMAFLRDLLPPLSIHHDARQPFQCQQGYVLRRYMPDCHFATMQRPSHRTPARLFPPSLCRCHYFSITLVIGGAARMSPVRHCYVIFFLLLCFREACLAQFSSC